MSSSVQLLLYDFPPGGDFEGRLVGALERVESGGALRIRDVLFVSRDPATGELAAIGRQGDGAGGVVGPLLAFRLDDHARGRATERALEESGDLVRDLAAGLEPGGALAAVLVEHRWRDALEDAVARTGGTLRSGEFVEATRLADVAPGLLR